MASLRATVHGRVQGVFFRAFVEDRAVQLNLTGYVRNRPGNIVEVNAEGDKPDLEKLVDFLKAGPPGSRVDSVDVEWVEYTANFKDFSARY
ncbi:MAG: acylphosphatase [Dehalococcoidales bacterium]|jgi:acylphosphatase